MIYKINPAVKEYIWAGDKLKKYYGKKTDLDKISETWEFSLNPSGESYINVDGMITSLKEYMENFFIGNNLKEKTPELLIKLIDSSDDLSIQVHPSDEYALSHYNKMGKTEAWYIIEADNDSCIYLGFNDDYTKEQVEEALNNGTILTLLNKINVKSGDFFKIPSGTIHAIGKNITLYEIQENSDLTFRLYDYDRTDKDGNKRELHINQALEVLNYKKYDLSINNKNDSKVLFAHKYFELTKFNLYNEYNYKINDSSFASITVIKGELTINDIVAKRGDTYYVDPNTTLSLKGKAELLIARVPDLAIGLDVGGTSIKGLIIDDNGNIICETKVPTESDKGEDKVADNIALSYNLLLEKSLLDKDTFTKLGIGFPGSVDCARGVVVLSNNLGFRNTEVKRLAEERIKGVEVLLENDANCAALGEYFYTDKKKYHDMTFITLGTGVGSGIVIDNKLFKGGHGSLTELGHMRIKSDSYQCTCGGYGCFESLISLARIKMDVHKLLDQPNSTLKEKMSKEDNPLKIFDFDKTDEQAKAYVRKYQNILLLGLTNIANILQPQIIVIGGGVSYVVSKYFPIIEKRLNYNKYGSTDMPKMKIVQATLGNYAGGYGACALTKI